MLGFSIMQTKNFQTSKLDLENVEEREVNCQHSLDYRESKGISGKISLCFIDYTKAFNCVDHDKLWKALRWEYQNT